MSLGASADATVNDADDEVIVWPKVSFKNEEEAGDDLVKEEKNDICVTAAAPPASNDRSQSNHRSASSPQTNSNCCSQKFPESSQTGSIGLSLASPYADGSLRTPNSMANSRVAPPFTNPFIISPYAGDGAHFSSNHFQPPPAHQGLVRPPVYSMAASPYPHQYSIFDHSHFPWHSPLPIPLHPWLSSPPPSQHGGAYTSSIQPSPAVLSNLSHFSSPANRASIPAYPGYQPPLPHSAIVTPGPKQNISSFSPGTSSQFHRLYSHFRTSDSNLTSEMRSPVNGVTNKKAQKRALHVKKPLNAFMLFMKAKRNDVMGEYSLKESAQINQLLGKKWHALSREEQSEYYEKAKNAREEHMTLYPNWSARDNYVSIGKKRRKKKDKNADGNSTKKCRARLGESKKKDWCKACQRKKKCTRYTDGLETNESEVGSVGESPTPTPESFVDSDNNQELNSITSPSSVPTNIDNHHPPQSLASRIVNGTLNPNDINHPLSVSQLTSQSHHNSSSIQSQNESQSPLSPLSLPSPISNCSATNSSTVVTSSINTVT